MLQWLLVLIPVIILALAKEGAFWTAPSACKDFVITLLTSMLSRVRWLGREKFDTWVRMHTSQELPRDVEMAYDMISLQEHGEVIESWVSFSSALARVASICWYHAGSLRYQMGTKPVV